MIARLARIQKLIFAVTALSAVVALGAGLTRPAGIALGGGIAFVDFAVLRRLAAVALAHRPRHSVAFGLALAKSLLLLVAPAAGLLLPATVIDGASFAVGVSALPVAIVLDAFLGAPPLPAA